MLGKREQGMAERRVAAPEALGSTNQPTIEAILMKPRVGEKFGMVAFGVVHQVPGMNFEEASEQLPRGIRQMRAGAGLDLGEVTLAKGLTQFVMEGANEFALGERAAQTAQAAFNLA